MLTLASSVRIFLHREPVDFRKSHDGLAAIVDHDLKSNPLDGSLYVFLNKRRDRIKLLQFDGNGFWVHYKRLEKGTFSALAIGPAISRAELSMLLEGIELKRGKIGRRFADSIRVDSKPERPNDIHLLQPPARSTRAEVGGH